MQTFGNIFASTRNKRIVRVVIAYAAVAWVFAQLAISLAVANKAATGEIRATRLVKDLVTGFDFDDGKITELEDIDGEWTLFAVGGDR